MATLFLSVFHLPALLRQGIPIYLENLAEPESILGNEAFLFPLVLEDGELRIPTLVTHFEVTASECRMDLEGTLKLASALFPEIIRQASADYDFIGGMFVSLDESGRRVFQSTYYTMDGFYRLLEVCGFDGCSIWISPQDKGLVVRICPEEGESAADQTLITCINNVLGNVFYQHQTRELRKIARLVKGESSPWAPSPPADPLQIWRARLDALDWQILQSVAQRMSVSQEIGRFKEARGLAVHDPTREHRVLESRRRIGEGLELDGALVTDLMQIILDHSKRVQKR